MLVKVETYLDSNAGAPLHPRVVEALLPFLNQSSRVLIPNPSSIHSHGRRAKRFLAEAREKIAASLGSRIDPEQIIFTSSGTEANQLVVRSVFEPLLLKGAQPHWILSAVEHDSNRQMVKWLEARGGSASVLPVDSNGNLRLEILPELIRPETALISAVWVNNETGVISNISALAQISKAKGIPLHIDAAQAWGKLPIELNTLGAQFVTFSAHKIGGLAGTGVLWLAQGHPAHAAILGKQEKGRRGGSENLLGAIAAGAAAGAIGPLEWSENVVQLRDRLQDAICVKIPGTQVNGALAPRVSNTLNLTFEGVEGDGLVMAMDLAGYSVSSGSACASGVLEPSHVLLAMGLSQAQAMAAVRISITESHSWENLEGFVSALEQAVLRVRKASRRRDL